MGKIYEGESKLNIVQVVNSMVNEMPHSHKEVIARQMCAVYTPSDGNPNYRSAVNHAMLDAYKLLPSGTETEEKSKKYCLHAINKYMKSTTKMDGEDSVYKMLYDSIMDSIK